MGMKQEPFTEEDEKVMLDVANRLILVREELDSLLDQVDMLTLVAQCRKVPHEKHDVLLGHLSVLRYLRLKLHSMRVDGKLAEHRVNFWL